MSPEGPHFPGKKAQSFQQIGKGCPGTTGPNRPTACYWDGQFGEHIHMGTGESRLLLSTQVAGHTNGLEDHRPSCPQDPAKGGKMQEKWGLRCPSGPALRLGEADCSTPGCPGPRDTEGLRISCGCRSPERAPWLLAPHARFSW